MLVYLAAMWPFWINTLQPQLECLSALNVIIMGTGELVQFDTKLFDVVNIKVD